MTSCTSVKSHPDYVGVAPELQSTVNEYLRLSKQNHIAFTNTVTVGFKILNQTKDDKNVVGLCNYGSGFREIDVDRGYWDTADKVSRLVFLFHELSHCYCNRGHDYDGGVYLETEQKRVDEALRWQKKGGKKPGRYEEDGCPISLMYPVVLSDDCTLAHYSDYVHEMFNNCKPY